jgi:hypothetical protein
MKKKNISKGVLIIVFVFIFFNLNASDNSCTGGGTMYVCGGEQVVQAVSDADSNCAEGFSTKKVIDVCSPFFYC